MNTRHTRRCLNAFFGLAGVLLTVIPQPLLAQDRGNPGWYARLAPYLWYSNLGGAMTLGLPHSENTVGDFNVPVHDTILDPAWAARLELGKGRLRLLVNASGADLAHSTEFTRVSDPADSVDGSYDFSWQTVEVYGAVQVGAFTSDHSWELYAGGRYVKHEQNITAAGSLPSSVSETWVDPVLGARLFTELGRRFWASFVTDIGGFSVGSDFTWTLGGELAYRVAKPLDLSMRYSYQEVEYDNGLTGSAAYVWNNGVQQGWFFGAIFKL